MPPTDVGSLWEITAAIAPSRVGMQMLLGKAEGGRIAGAIHELIGISDAVARVRRAAARTPAQTFCFD